MQVIIMTMLVQVIMIFFAAAMMLFAFMFFIKSGRTLTYCKLNSYINISQYLYLLLLDEMRKSLFNPDYEYFNNTAILDEVLNPSGSSPSYRDHTPRSNKEPNIELDLMLCKLYLKIQY